MGELCTKIQTGLRHTSENRKILIVSFNLDVEMNSDKDENVDEGNGHQPSSMDNHWRWFHDDEDQDWKSERFLNDELDR